MTYSQFFRLLRFVEQPPFPFLTRELFNTLIIAVIIIGLALAFVRLYADFTRPLLAQDQTRPNQRGDNNA